MITIVNSLSQQHEVYERLTIGNRINATLYGFKNPTLQDVVDLLRSGIAYEVAKEKNEPIGLAWFNNFNGRTAFCHFCIYKGMMPQALYLVRHGLDYAFDLGFTAFFGLTPAPYKAALARLVIPAGFEVLHIEPNMCYMARKEKFVPGVLTHLSREKWKTHRQSPIWAGVSNDQ